MCQFNFYSTLECIMGVQGGALARRARAGHLFLTTQKSGQRAVPQNQGCVLNVLYHLNFNHIETGCFTWPFLRRYHEPEQPVDPESLHSYGHMSNYVAIYCDLQF